MKMQIGYLFQQTTMNLCDKAGNDYWQQYNMQYLLAYNMEKIIFTAFSDELLVEINNGIWESGRIWNNELQVKWQRKSDNTLHIVVIAPEDKLPAEIELACTDLQIINETSDYVYLWGEQEKDGNVPLHTWFEKRIPHILTYPVPGTEEPRLQLKVYEYQLIDETPLYYDAELHIEKHAGYVQRYGELIPTI